MAMLSVIRKTIYFCKRNGLRSTVLAVKERLANKAKAQAYTYDAPDASTLKMQRDNVGENAPLFSIVVPLFETGEQFLEELIDSVLQQSYARFELILGDFSAKNTLEQTVNQYGDSRIGYHYFGDNQGIAKNTNRMLSLAKGEYVGLLDHDDILTPDALYEMYDAIRHTEDGKQALLLFSDEDKWSGEQGDFYDPHRKEEYNRELLYSYNYICHFLIIERELISKLGFREAYTGAQDYDLALRATKAVEETENGCIIHVPKVLYHWRCHRSSTAENPKSKLYAYEAGREALLDYFTSKEIAVSVEHRTFVGMYKINYEKPYLEARPEIGIAGGRVLQHRALVSGRLSRQGEVYYAGSTDAFGGYFHRAILPQDAEAVDLRSAVLRKELEPLISQVLQVPFAVEEGTGKLLLQGDFSEEQWKEKSIALCLAIKQAGYQIVWNPDQVADTQL